MHNTSMPYVYLIHFDKPLGHARHYVGYSANLTNRWLRHNQSSGSALLRACNQRGIKYHIARVWLDVEQSLERKIKKTQKHQTTLSNMSWTNRLQFH